MKLPFTLPALLLAMAIPAWVHAQSEDNEEGDDVVQYSLILPEEKAPELIRPEENNPFETLGNGQGNSENDTEENQVRDILLRLPIGGGASSSTGMRVMLGGMRLETGMEVPPVIPDQQVKLRVKSITPAAIELVWLEKKPSGLPPKVLVIPMDGTPKVRYRMPGGSTDSADSGPIGTISRSGVSAFSPGRMEAATAPAPATALPPGIRVTRNPAPESAANAAPTALPPGIRVTRNPPPEPAANAAPTALPPGIRIVRKPPPESAAPAPAPKQDKPDQEVVTTPPAPEKAPAPAAPPADRPATPPPPPATQAPDASVLRMLFGNRPPPTAR